MQTSRRMSVVVAIMGLVLAVASMFSVVPRIRLVEALSLFATAFGAGAGLVAALASPRRTTGR
jgi:hypothetical protein